MHDFYDVDDAINTITDVINNGDLYQNTKDTKLINLEKGDYRVVIAKEPEGNWVLSAFDFVTSKKEKLKRGKTLPPSETPGQSNEGAGAVTPNLSTDKVSENISSDQTTSEKITSTVKLTAKAV